MRARGEEVADLSFRRRGVVLRWRRRGGRRSGCGAEDEAHTVAVFSSDEDAIDERELLATVDATSLCSILSRLIEEWEEERQEGLQMEADGRTERRSCVERQNLTQAAAIQREPLTPTAADTNPIIDE